MQTFEEALQTKLDSDPALRRSANGKRIQKLLDLPPNNRRRLRAIDRMEEHARVHIGFKGSDWGKVKAPDWASLFELFMKLLPLILALFGL